MPNLIALIAEDGRILGRCNQHCYTAKDRTRPCICGGINNGVGLAQAKANLPRVIAHLATRPKRGGITRIKIFSGAARQKLFDQSR